MGSAWQVGHATARMSHNVGNLSHSKVLVVIIMTRNGTARAPGSTACGPLPATTTRSGHTLYRGELRAACTPSSCSFVISLSRLVRCRPTRMVVSRGGTARQASVFSKVSCGRPGKQPKFPHSRAGAVHTLDHARNKSASRVACVTHPTPLAHATASGSRRTVSARCNDPAGPAPPLR
jgi:hypothetical protein